MYRKTWALSSWFAWFIYQVSCESWYWPGLLLCRGDFLRTANGSPCSATTCLGSVTSSTEASVDTTPGWSSISLKRHQVCPLFHFAISILGATGEIVNSFYFRWRLQQLLAGMFIVLPLKNHIVWSYDEHTWKQCSWYLLTWQRETLSLSCSWEPTTVLSRTKDSTSPLMSTSQTWVTFSGMVTNFAFALFPFNVWSDTKSITAPCNSSSLTKSMWTCSQLSISKVE